jgi:glycosyltransferase involved in cell wall biosynthesis
MRIALISPLYAPFAGGVEQHVAMLAREMLRLGHEVEVLTTDPTGRLPAHDTHAQVSVKRFRSYGHGAFHFAPGLGGWLRRASGGYDVLHAHSYHQPLIVQAALCADAVPLVLTTHYHGVGHTRLAQAMHGPYRPLGRWALRRARYIVSVSDVERGRLTRDFGKLPIVSIPNGVDVAALLGTPRSGAQDTRTHVLSVGRLEPYKQPMRLLEAAPHLPEPYAISFVGEGTLRSSLCARADQLGVASRVRVRGRVPDDDVRRAYRSADVFVTLSLQESFGLTLLEAAVSGAAVVASDIAPHREVARFVPPGRIDFVPAASTPRGVAAAIVAAREHGRAEAQADWPVPTWKSVAELTLGVYTHCARIA